MNRFFSAALATALLPALAVTARAADVDAKAVLDKAIKALGGEEKLGKAKAFSWKSKGTITINGNDSEVTGRTTAEGLDRYRAEFEGEFNGNALKGVTVLNGDKGWRKFNDNLMEMDAEAVARQKRNDYLQVIPITLVALKGPAFKIEPAGEEMVDGKPAVGIKATAQDGKDFTLFFDKESGLPVKQVAKVFGFQDDEFTQETLYTDYKDFGGIKKSTKNQVKRNGETFLKSELSEFTLLDKVDPETFAEPK